MEPLKVREYLRVSRDVQQTGRSPDQQHAENSRSIEEHGWVLHSAPAYRDTDRSASRYAKVAREDFKRLIGDLAAGEFDADVLAIWESSRGSRRVGEWVDLVDLCKQRNVRIWVTTHGRLYDPANARDRRSLLEDAVDAEYESDKTSERRKRSARASAEEGRPHGKNIYGYLRVYDERTRALLRVEPHPEQAPIVQEAAFRALRGDAFYAIAKDFNERGVPPRRGRRLQPHENSAWTPSAVKQMLRIPAYAGKRDYRGVIVGDGMWPALVEFDDWQRLQAVLTNRGHRGPRDHTAKYLLTNIAQCGVCLGPMRVGRQNYAPRRLDSDGSRLPRRTYTYYVCAGIPGHPSPDGTKGWHAGMKTGLLDEIVVNLVFQRFAEPDALASFGNQGGAVAAERAELLALIAAHETYLDSIRKQAAAAHLFELVLDQEARIQPLIRAAREQLTTLSAMDPFVHDFLSTGDIESEWGELSLADQRRVIRAVVSPRVHRVGRGWSGLKTAPDARVEPVWR